MRKIVKVVTDLSEEEKWVRCNRCKKLIYIDELRENFKVCPYCGFHFRLTFKERIDILLDKNSFKEMFVNIESLDVLQFVDKEPYSRKIEEIRTKGGVDSSVVVGTGKIHGIEIAIGVLAFEFIGGSLGSAMGEKLKRIIYFAIDRKLPIIIISSSGGARMQEGIFSLMQMAKISSAISRYKKLGKLYISLLTNPTYGGVTASFAMLGDIIIAEPGAMIGFAGPRVIEQTIKRKLPQNFQTAEFLLEHGFIDIVVPRKELRNTVYQILKRLP